MGDIMKTNLHTQGNTSRGGRFGHARFWWIGLACLLIPTISHARAICATVRIEIMQEVAFERQAFEARMRINNGLPHLQLSNVHIELSFTDEFGEVVTFTDDPNHPDALFFVRVDSLAGVNNISGHGSIAPASEAYITWLIIPAPGAAGDSPHGTLYFVGARLVYSIGDDVNVTDVVPDDIYVLPMPDLELDYFLPYWVYGNDAWTEEIEPPVPFTLGVRVRNAGHGAARNMTIESSQPRIIENELGLLIGFTITGSEVHGEPAQPTLLVSFGDVPPHSARVARWIMECTLSGRFESFTATFSHADELGGQLTSLLSEVRTHRLVRDVLVDVPGRDAVTDFLAVDTNTMTYTVYESDNVDTPVTDLSPHAELTLQVNLPEERWQRLTIPSVEGALYADAPLPDGAGWEIATAVRLSDGKEIRPENVWIAKERFKDNPEIWHYSLHLFDIDGGGEYRITFVPTEEMEPHLPVVGNVFIARIGDNPIDIHRDRLLRYSWDPLGGALILDSVAAVSANGATLTYAAPYVTYTPIPANQDEDTFTFVVRNADGTTEGLAHVVVMPAAAGGMEYLVNLRSVDGELRFHFIGFPGYTFYVEASPSLTDPDWQPVGAYVIDQRGDGWFTHSDASPHLFYRIRSE